MTTPSYLGKRVRSSAFLTPYYLGKRQDVGTGVDPNTLYPVSEHHSYVDRNLMDFSFGYATNSSVLAPPGSTWSLDGTYLFLFDFVLERKVVNPVMRVFLTGEDDFEKKEDWIEIGQSTTPTVHTDTRLTFKDAVQITIPTSLYGLNLDGYEPGQTRRRIVFGTGDGNRAYLNSYTEWRTFYPTAIIPDGIHWWKDVQRSQRMYDDFIISPNASSQLVIPANTLTAEYGYFEVSTPDLKGNGTYWDYPYGGTAGQTFPPNSVWTTIPSKPWTGVVWSSGNADVTLTQSELVNHDGKKLYAHVKAGTSTTPWTNIEYHIKMPITIRVLPTFKVGLTPEIQSKDDADLSNCVFVRTLLLTNGYLGNFPNEPVRYTWSIHKLSDDSEVFSIEGTKTLSATLTFDAIAAHPGTSDTTHYVRCNCTLYCPSKPSIEGETRFAKYEKKISQLLNPLPMFMTYQTIITQPPTGNTMINGEVMMAANAYDGYTGTTEYLLVPSRTFKTTLDGSVPAGDNGFFSCRMQNLVTPGLKLVIVFDQPVVIKRIVWHHVIGPPSEPLPAVQVYTDVNLTNEITCTNTDITTKISETVLDSRTAFTILCMKLPKTGQWFNIDKLELYS